MSTHESSVFFISHVSVFLLIDNRAFNPHSLCVPAPVALAVILLAAAVSSSLWCYCYGYASSSAKEEKKHTVRENIARSSVLSVQSH